MAINKSAYQELELESKQTVYAQIGSTGRAHLSFDGQDTQFSLWLEVDEMTKLAQILQLAVEEYNHGQAAQE